MASKKRTSMDSIIRASVRTRVPALLGIIVLTAFVSQAIPWRPGSIIVSHAGIGSTPADAFV